MIADTEEIKRAVKIIADPGGHIQLVSITSAYAAAELVNGRDADATLAAVERLPEGIGIYFAINPVREGVAKKANAGDVTRRWWLFLDVDPVRAQGYEKEPATAAEKEAALLGANAVFEYLDARGFPSPVITDSGNGYGLFYRVDLPNNEKSRDAIKALLHHLAVVVKIGGCKVDTSVHNADRLARLPGSWNRKGTPSADRPHRPCRLLSVPDRLEEVTIDMIRAATPDVKDPKPNGVAPNPAEPWRSHWARRATSADAASERTYCLKAMDGERTKLATTLPGDRDNQLYRSGAALGDLVGPGRLTEQEVFNALLDSARWCGLVADIGEPAVREKLGRAIAKGMTNPRVFPNKPKKSDRGQANPQPNGGPGEPPGSGPPGGIESFGDAHSGGTWEIPAPLPDLSFVPPFPIDLFPRAVADYWRDSARAFNVPVDYVAVTGLAVLGAAIGRSRAAQVKPGYEECPLFWGVVVAPPGSTKSPSLRAARAPLDRAEAEWRACFEEEKKEYEQELARRKDGDEYPERPVLKQILLDDTTVEAAARVLSDNPRGLVLLKDELIGLVRSLNQYKGGRGADKLFWLTAWNGRGPVKVNRVSSHNDGPLVIPDPFVAVAGMICPDSLPELREELAKGGAVADGWSDRFLLSYPNPLPAEGETWRTVSPEVRDGYENVVRALLVLRMVRDSGARHDRPFFDRFDDEAKSAWESFTTAIAHRINDLPPADPYRGVLAKLKHYAVRFTALFSTLGRVTGEFDISAFVSGQCVKRAEALAFYFDAHGRRCLGVADSRTEAARSLLAALQEREGESFTKRALYQDVRGQTRFRRAASLDAPLQLLSEHGYICALDPNQRPGRPSERYRINPLWDRIR
jgi:hypothetical protein